MTRKGIDVVLNAGRTVWKNNPWLLQPVADFFGVNIEERLHDESLIADLIYSEY
jgi:4-hydroxy-tetrahydrodipicolinate synthase